MTFTRTGYTQTGWATSKGGSKVYNLNATVTFNSNITLYPTWTANTYTVTFNANGGSVSTASKSVTYNSTYGDLPTPTRTGYTFKGWYSAASGGTQVKANTKVAITANQTLYAQWNPITYTVRFHKNDGTSTTADQTHTYDKEQNLRWKDSDLGWNYIGHNFKGWANASDGTVVYTNGQMVKNLASTQGAICNLYAHWTANTYTVTFNANGGSVSTTSKTVTYNSTYGTLPTPTRTGYTFKGWYSAASGGTQVKADTKVEATSNHSLYAHWEVQTYTVSLNQQDGVGGTESISVSYNGTLPDITIPTKAGFDFNGYYAEEGGSGTKYYNANGSPAQKWDKGEGAILYAHWTVKKYTITFNANGGQGGKSEDLDFGVPLSAPTVSRVGYAFAGWNPTVPSTVPAENATYVAQWTANTYTVTFNANGGSGAMGDIQCTYDYSYGLLANTFYKVGHKFEGWSLSSDGNVEYGDSASIKNLTAENGAIVTLYAVWSAIEYQVCLIRNTDYNNHSYCEMVSYGQYWQLPGFSTLVEWERIGYSFTGWNTDKDGSGISYADGETIRDLRDTGGDVYLYAQWTANTYTVTFNANGGSVSTASKSVTYGSPYGELPIPILDGYKFAGWKSEHSQELIMSTTLVPVAQDDILTAVWVDDEIVVRFDAQTTEVQNPGYRIYPDGATYSEQGDLPILTRTGYAFNGWFASNGKQVGDEDAVGIIDHTLYAHWTANTYSLKLDGGYDNKVKDFTLTYDEKYTLETIDALGWKWHGYTFKGWSKEENAVVAEYDDGDTVENLTAEQGATITLYAVWGMNRNTVNVCVMDETTQSMLGIPAEKVLSSSPAPNNGGTSLQWEYYENPTVTFTPVAEVEHNSRRMKLINVTDGNGSMVSTGGSWTVEIDTNLTYNLYYKKTAKIEVGFAFSNDQTMGFLSIDGDESILDREVFAGDNVAIAAEAKAGYIFKGWYHDENTERLYSEFNEITVTVDEDTALFAKFIQDPEGIYEWEGSSVPKSMEWVGKTYIGATPFCPATCRIDARGYEQDGRKSMLEFQWGMFSSPDGSPEQMRKIEISSQDARRLPVVRKERYMRIGVKSDVEIDALFVGTSMGGLVV